MSRFYTTDKIVKGQIITLDREESHHLSRVLRLGAGDTIQLIDGNGTLATAEIREVGKLATAEIREVTVEPSQDKVTLAFGISKSAAVEFLVRRATEIGLKSLQPLLTQHSLHPDSWNEERWNRLIVEVAKQCETLHFPQLLPPKRLKDWLEGRDGKAELVYCYENSRNDQLSLSKDNFVDLVVGSEGGFSHEEIQQLQAKGAKSLGLGKNKLRVETASLVALVLVKQKISEI